jgi:hypothetical protein
VLPVELPQTDEGAVIVETGDPIGMVVFCEPPLLQPALLVTVQFKTTLPLELALNVIEWVPEPAVIVPPLIVQLYVPPEDAGTEAVFPVELAQTDAGAVIVEPGSGLIVTTSVAVAAPQGEDWPVVVKVSVTAPAVTSAVDGV